jgi:hypothetical protein
MEDVGITTNFAKRKRKWNVMQIYQAIINSISVLITAFVKII